MYCELSSIFHLPLVVCVFQGPGSASKKLEILFCMMPTIANIVSDNDDYSTA